MREILERDTGIWRPGNGPSSTCACAGAWRVQGGAVQSGLHPVPHAFGSGREATLHGPTRFAGRSLRSQARPALHGNTQGHILITKGETSVANTQCGKLYTTMMGRYYYHYTWDGIHYTAHAWHTATHDKDRRRDAQYGGRRLQNAHHA